MLGGRVVDAHVRCRLAGVWAVFVRTRDMGGAQALRRCRSQIVRVGCNHHAFAGREIERIDGGEIDVRLRLVVARDVGAQDRIPAQFVAPREIGHQSDVAVGAGRDQELGAEPRETALHIGPRIEPVPGEIEIGEHVRREHP